MPNTAVLPKWFIIEALVVLLALVKTTHNYCMVNWDVFLKGMTSTRLVRLTVGLTLSGYL